MKIFNGKRVADEILFDFKKRIKKLKTKPSLAVILVGDNPDSKVYIRLKKEAAKKVGIELEEFYFKKTVKEKKVIDKVKELNKKPSVNGILIQLPLPKGFNPDRIIRTISPLKDVDGFVSPYLVSVLPSAILIALRGAKKNLKNKKILAVVNSEFFGKSLKEFLTKKGIKISYLLCNKRLKKETKSANVLITVCGCPSLIKGEMVKKGAILIDAGFRRFPNGRVIGDINRKSLKDKASFLTPTPGGIGPLTVALLLKNVYLATKLHGKR